MVLLKSGNIDLFMLMLNTNYCVNYSLVSKDDRAGNTNLLMAVEE